MDGRWLYSATDGLDARVEISTIDCVLQLAEVYERVDFTESESESVPAPS